MANKEKFEINKINKTHQRIPLSIHPLQTRMSIVKYICVLDFEANCTDDTKKVGMDNEVIEFPSVLWKLENGKLTNLSEFQLFCKPKNTPILTDFCKKLTGITQDQVDAGTSFPKALKNHELWLRSNISDFDTNVQNSNVIIVTCGDWDLNVMAPKEYKNHKIDPHSVYTKYVNIKDEFTKFYNISNSGMADMLTRLKIPLEGKHHSGIDDCRNISKILIQMFNDGYTYERFNICYVFYTKIMSKVIKQK